MKEAKGQCLGGGLDKVTVSHETIGIQWCFSNRLFTSSTKVLEKRMKIEIDRTLASCSFMLAPKVEISIHAIYSMMQ